MRMILSRLIPAVMHGIGLFASMLSHGATPVGVLSIEAATSVPPLARGFGGTPQQGIRVKQGATLTSLRHMCFETTVSITSRK
jgi:hypothetical protein